MILETFLAIGSLYFTFGLGLYLGLALKDPKGFLKADAAGLMRGLILGILFWPIGLIVQVLFVIDQLEGVDEDSL